MNSTHDDRGTPEAAAQLIPPAQPLAGELARGRSVHELAKRPWDVLVIGAGLGGAVIGHALAKTGSRVLFVEKGHYLHDRLAPAFNHTSALVDETPAELMRRGRWPVPLSGDTNFGRLEFHAPLGCGSGGSSTLYAAQMERLSPTDFFPRSQHRVVSRSTVPEKWPIEYADLEPWYRAAEDLFSVTGTPDPLEEAGRELPLPPPMSERDHQLFDFLVHRGLHPYRAHVACRFLPDCQNCGGRFCERMCKQDSGWACLVPALATGNAALVSNCDIHRIDADRTRVRRVLGRCDGQDVQFSAKTVILAAGAYMSPLILLRSKSKTWPDGLANSSGRVGRNLMVHTGDMVAVKPQGRPSTEGPPKSIALNDFYHFEGTRLGTFQSMGVEPDPGHIYNYLRGQAKLNPTWWRSLSVPFLKPAAMLAWTHYRNSAVFATIVEDLPYSDNRVVPDSTTPSGMRFEYQSHDELLDRNRVFRRLLVKRLGSTRVAFLSGANNLNFGHPCGTCRFGEDPKTSVLDLNNRAHDLENLYVVDGSFMPSSGGTNPSLTIAANALRVAAAIRLAAG